MKTFTATQAKQNFGEMLDEARINDITILKNGHPFVVVSNINQDAHGGYSLYRELLEDSWHLKIPMPRLDDNEIQRMSDTMTHFFNLKEVSSD